jgi:hypothetical protein
MMALYLHPHIYIRAACNLSEGSDKEDLFWRMSHGQGKRYDVHKWDILIFPI